MIAVQNGQDQGFDPTPTREHMCGMGWEKTVDHRRNLQTPEYWLSDSFGEINGAIPSSFVDSAFMVSMATPEHIEITALCSGSYSGSHRHSCKRKSTHQAGAA